MMPAAKHGDPQLGVDIHLCVVPPSPSPVPLPTPHTSVVFDPFDYVPILGATVTVCGMKRATAGTNGIAIHIPPGFPFAPKLPDKDDELFMGSATVVADGDPFSFIAVPVLACQVAGMMSPFRPKKKGGPKAMVLPTVFNLAIPTNVFVGGPPTISLMGLAMKGAFAALGRLAKSGLFKRIRQKLFKNMKPGFLKCKVLRAEPVNLLTGEVSVEQEDFTLPGRIPIDWVRSYSSGNSRPGACGYGWESTADIRLEVDPVDGAVSLRHPTVGPLFFANLPLKEGHERAEFELMDGARLSDHGTEFRVRTKEDRIYHFPKALVVAGRDGVTAFPIGRIADLCGNWLEFERRAGRLAAIVESAGRRIEVVSERGRVTEVALVLPDKDFRHVFVRYEYDTAGDLVAVIDALGNPYRFEYDEHHLVRHTDRRGLSFYYEYDAGAPDGWRVVHSWGDGGLYDYRFEYDDVLNERRITDSLGHVSVVKLDERGLPISEIDALGGVTVYEYDEAGRTTAVVDPDGHRTEHAYDTSGNLLRLTHPDGSIFATTYTGEGKPEVVVDPNGNEWRRLWNERGLLVLETTPLRAVSRYEYDDFGQVRSYVNALGHRTEFHYDAVGNMTRLTDPAGNIVQNRYDVLGNVIELIDALTRRRTYQYDLKSRLTAAALPSGATVRWAYDGADNVIAYADENEAVTRFDYFGQGEITACHLPDGHELRYEYDTEERLTGVVNQRGETFQIHRDDLGRVVTEVDYWGQASSFQYSPAGHIRQWRGPLGVVTDYATDAMGRVVEKRSKGASGSAVVEHFKFNPAGNLVACWSPTWRVERECDAEGRLTLERQGEHIEVHNRFDADGNRVERQIHVKEGELSRILSGEFLYDRVGELVELKAAAAPPLTIERDACGQAVGQRFGTSVHASREFNQDGYCVRHRVSLDAEPVTDVVYDYDRAGNLRERREYAGGTDRYRYDALGRLIEHSSQERATEVLSTDPAGDRLQLRIVTAAQTSGSDSQSAGTWWREGEYNGTHYRFDARGSMVQAKDPDRTLELEWDANSRLSEARRDGAVTRYDYDPLGRRVRKHIGDRTVEFAWDGEVLAAEISLGADGLGDAVRGWVHIPDTAEPLALLGHGASPVLTVFHNEPNGFPALLTTERAVEWSAPMTAWGAVDRPSVNVIDNPIRLQGQYADQETGLHYSVYRHFEPKLGQFVSIDPLRVDGGPSLYSYGPNAFAWIDPLGLKCYVAVRDPVQGVIRGKRLSQKQALARIRRGLDVIADSASEAKSLAKRALVGKPMKHGPHGPRPLYLPHYHPSQHANASHVFFP
jgi:RHS repeat-associated protein